MANYWGVYTKDWVVSTNVNTDDINYPCYVEHRYECGRIRKWSRVNFISILISRDSFLTISRNYSKFKVFRCIIYPLHRGFSKYPWKIPLLPRNRLEPIPSKYTS